ncbi:MAG: hypothetical protein KA319_11620 [Ferruginibacter sp.]|nr:hypothetical protein [Ferruginibacter sp.]
MLQYFKIIVFANFFLHFAISNTAYCQLQNKIFEEYTIKDGLTDNNIKAILQDKYGYVWIATENGLNRFDGLNFTAFPFSKNNTPLPSNKIVSIKLLDADKLVIATTGGISILYLNTLLNTNIIIPPNELKYSYKVNYAKKILVDTTGNFYVTTKSGFYHFNKKNELVFRYDDYLPSEAELGMAFGDYTYWLNSEIIVMAGLKGIYLYNVKSKELKKTGLEGTNFLLTKEIIKLKDDYHLLQPWPGKFIILNYKSDILTYIDEVNNIIKHSKILLAPVSSAFTWRSNLFAINDTTLLLSGKFDGLYTFKLNQHSGTLSLDTNALFKGKKCNTLFIDKEKKYWIGFKVGLKFEKTSNINLRQSNVVDKDESQNKITDIFQTAVTNKNIYTANLVSGGLHQFNKTTLEYRKKISFIFPPFGNKSIFAVEKWSGDSLVCGTDVGLFLYNEKKDKSEFVHMPNWDVSRNWVSNLFLDSKKNIWIASNIERGCYVWKYKTKLPHWLSFESKTGTEFKSVFHFAEDTKGNIWLAGKGAARYNVNESKIDIHLNSFSNDPFATLAIESIACDETNGVWMAYSTNGLVHYSTVTKQKLFFTIADGLPDNIVQDLKYYQNYIWITCKNGIAKINCTTKKITTVCNLKEVNYSIFTSNNLVLDTPTGDFIAATGSSIIKFNAINKAVKNSTPNLFVENITFENDSIHWYPQNNIQLNWKNRNIILTFNAINFSDAAYQKYAYRIINGNTTDWVLLNDQRKIVFNKLSAGITTIQIKVFSSQNIVEENIIEFTINIIAPFWRTTWFYFLCFLVFLAILYSIFKYRQNQLKKIANIRENISNDLHDEVGATLSGISMYSHLVKTSIEKNEVDNATQSVLIIQKSASEMVGKLNDIVLLLRPNMITLKELIYKISEFATEMGAAKQLKIIIDKSGFNNNTKCSVELRKNIYLFCKEAINNSIKYSNATILTLNFTFNLNKLEIIIEDDGFGFDLETVKRGNGLNNLQKRANDVKGDFKISTSPGKGCKIYLKLKITQ